MAVLSKNRPDWGRLYETAAACGGYFSTRQAAESGYSVQLLKKHVGAGRLRRARRGIYRVVHFPAGEHEDLIEIWLWSGLAGVFSHETALALQDLSDALPGRIHLTLPASWQRRRLRVPRGVVLHFADVARADQTWVDAIPVTGPRRTIADCIVADVQPDLVRQALQQAGGNGSISREEAMELRRLLKRHGCVRP
ncbi:MAG: type IV toxin-antitoxin system AbiEi family antitoxin domain-containing protein [Planctomycetes bacterium]|nr:type IV toxin-antitoxin system AbiEi family antitoxin domain-containing protein [Planctomycetota bacterium]